MPIAAGDRGIMLGSLEEMFRFARYVHASGMAPKGLDTVEKVLIAMQMGLELGLSKMQAIQNVAVINGRPVIWGDAMLAICRASGVFDDTVFEETIEGEGANMVATCTVCRIGGKPRVERFSMADAKKAQLDTKPGPWQQYPKRMLKMRARGFALRDTFPDFLRGISCAEEAMDMPTVVVNSAPRRIADLIAEDAAQRVAQEQPVTEQTAPAAAEQHATPEPEQPTGTTTLEAEVHPKNASTAPAKKAAPRKQILDPVADLSEAIKAAADVPTLNELRLKIEARRDLDAEQAASLNEALGLKHNELTA